MATIICDFGRNRDGLFLYRVNGDKKEIDQFIRELDDLGCELYEPIEIEKAHKSYSVLLKIKFPPRIESQILDKKERILRKE